MLDTGAARNSNTDRSPQDACMHRVRTAGVIDAIQQPAELGVSPKTDDGRMAESGFPAFCVAELRFIGDMFSDQLTGAIRNDRPSFQAPVCATVLCMSVLDKNFCADLTLTRGGDALQSLPIVTLPCEPPDLESLLEQAEVRFKEEGGRRTELRHETLRGPERDARALTRPAEVRTLLVTETLPARLPQSARRKRCPG